MNILEHTIVGNKIIIEEYNQGYGDKIELMDGATKLETNVETTSSGIVIPTKMDQNINFMLSKIKMIGDAVDDKQFEKEFIVLVPRSSCLPIEIGSEKYFATTPASIVAYWEEGDHDNFKITNQWMLVDEYDDHDYVKNKFIMVNSNNKLRALIGKVVKIGEKVDSEIAIGNEILYEKNSTKDIHIDRHIYKIVNIKSVISYWE